MKALNSILGTAKQKQKQQQKTQTKTKCMYQHVVFVIVELSQQDLEVLYVEINN